MPFPTGGASMDAVSSDLLVVVSAVSLGVWPESCRPPGTSGRHPDPPLGLIGTEPVAGHVLAHTNLRRDLMEPAKPVMNPGWSGLCKHGHVDEGKPAHQRF